MDGAIGSGPAVRPAETASEREAAAEALALAFSGDPCWEHLLPDDRRRPEQLLAYFTSEIETLTPDYRELWVTEDGAGAALWAPPGRWRVPMGVTAGEARRMIGVFGRRLPLGLWTILRLERHHPKSPKHWYLHYLGVEPRLQGKGLGSALMAPVLDRYDWIDLDRISGRSTGALDDGLPPNYESLGTVPSASSAPRCGSKSRPNARVRSRSSCSDNSASRRPICTAATDL